MGKAGRPPIAVFNAEKNPKLQETATEAGNLGAYTVESLCPGICYMIYNDKVSIATAKGSMTVHTSTAKVICSELADILKDADANKREGMHPMSTRRIGQMLGSDFK